MKKLVMLLALASVSVAGFAQTETPTEKYSVATNSFWSNWFIQANVAGSAFWSNEEKGWNLDKSPLKDFRNNLGFTVAIGKWFTPGIGLRTKFNGIWGRSVAPHLTGGVADKKEFASKYFNLNEQVLLNVSNLLCGYNENRVWNFIPYFGGGFQRSFSYNTYAMGLGVGLLNEFRLSKKLAINLEASYSFYEADADGVSKGGKEPAKDRVWDGRDKHLTVELGLTYNLGKATWNKVPDVEALKALSQSQIDALNAQLADAQNENARLKNMLANQPKGNGETKVVNKVVTTPVSVFFNLNSAKIASKKDLVNLQEIANYAKSNNAGIAVTGYADSKTGTSEINQTLSEKRAAAVADALVDMGVSRDKISTSAAGGVDELSPAYYNRRATVKVQ